MRHVLFSSGHDYTTYSAVKKHAQVKSSIGEVVGETKYNFRVEISQHRGTITTFRSTHWRTICFNKKSPVFTSRPAVPDQLAITTSNFYHTPCTPIHMRSQVNFSHTICQ